MSNMFLANLTQKENRIKRLIDDYDLDSLSRIKNPTDEEIYEISTFFNRQAFNEYIINHKLNINEELRLKILLHSSNFFPVIPLKERDNIKILLHKDPSIIRYIDKEDEELQLLAISVNKQVAVKNIYYPSFKVQEIILEADANSFSNVKCELRLDIQEQLVEKGFFSYIRKPSKEIRLKAIKRRPRNILSIPKPTYEEQKLAVSLAGHLVNYIENSTEELKMIAVRTYRNFLHEIDLRTISNELLYESIKYYPKSLLYVINQTPELIRHAFKYDINNEVTDYADLTYLVDNIEAMNNEDELVLRRFFESDYKEYIDTALINKCNNKVKRLFIESQI